MAVPTTWWNQLPPVIRRGNTYECFVYGEEFPLLPGEENAHVVGFQYRFWDNRDPEPGWTDVPPDLVTLWWEQGWPTCEMWVTQTNLQNNRTFTLDVRAVDNLGQVDEFPISYTFRTPIQDHELRTTSPRH